MVKDRLVDIGIKLHIREWEGNKTPFVLLHGLSSNSRTWDAVAQQLAGAGHRVIAVDQRGHGQSDKPDDGYDFATITADLYQLLQVLNLNQPILVGQSWGGNVLLDFGARYSGTAGGLGFVDGGFIDLQSRPDATWEKVSTELKPPSLNGTHRESLKARIQQGHPDWDEAGVDATLANFKTLADGTVRPWLNLSRHMTILRAMWGQRPDRLVAHVLDPVLICAAQDPNNPNWMAVKAKQVAALQNGLPQSETHWFDRTDHDIHVHRPAALTKLFLDTLSHGIWSK
jgi:pimeloyl-ACP methyl ester carboxylesterase